MSSEQEKVRWIGSYPVLSETDYAKAAGSYRVEAGTYRFTGFAHRSSGGDIFDLEEWIEFKDLLTTFGSKERPFEVSTRAKGPNYALRVNTPEEIIAYEIGLADFTKSEGGMMPWTAYGEVGLLTKDWTLIIQVHFAAVDAFTAGSGTREVEAVICEKARTLGIETITEDEMDRIFRAARGW